MLGDPILGNDTAGVSPLCCKHMAREVTGTWPLVTPVAYSKTTCHSQDQKDRKIPYGVW